MGPPHPPHRLSHGLGGSCGYGFVLVASASRATAPPCDGFCGVSFSHFPFTLPPSDPWTAQFALAQAYLAFWGLLRHTTVLSEEFLFVLKWLSHQSFALFLF